MTDERTDQERRTVKDAPKAGTVPRDEAREAVAKVKRERTERERKSDRRIFVETMVEIADDLSDGAFWGFMEEHGIDAEEVAALSEDGDGDESEADDAD